MRIAEIAPVWFTVPPRGYGGIELVMSLLADGLVDRGHDVTLFASGGSATKAELVTPMEDPPDPSLLGTVWYEAYHAVASWLRVRDGDFDVVHDHSGVIGPGIGGILDGPPVVHTLHGAWTEQAKHYYALLHPHVNLVAISEAQRNEFPAVSYAGTVYNGIDVRAFPFRDDKEDFLVFLGRVNPDKGPGIAVEIAKRRGEHLKMIVKKTEPFERDYWDRVVAPQLTSDVEVYENLAHDEKVDILSRAKALVFPIRWSEPFGLVMIEAMACGTPVVTSPMGAAPELVIDGVTGFLRSSFDELAAAIDHVGDISPAACRRRVEEHFSADAMVRGYEEIFERVTNVAGGAGFPLRE